MSTVDKRSFNYIIKDYKICELSKEESYIDICDATDDAIAAYLENNDSLYDYDRGIYLDKSAIKPICEDAFGNSIYMGSRIVLLDMYYNDSFNQLATGTIIGETDSYVKIKSDIEDMHKRGIYSVPYILRRKDSKRFLLIRKLK